MKTAKDLELLLLIKEHEKQKLQIKINKAIEYIEAIQKQWNDESVPERNIYLFETYLEGVSKLVAIKDILKGDDKDGKN